MNDVSNYDIKKTNSRIHGLSSVYKVLSVLFMIIFIILSCSKMDVFMINLLLLVIIAWTNIKLKIFLKVLLMFWWLLLFVFLLLSLIYLDFFVGLIWVVKLIDLLLYLSIIGFTTSYYDLYLGTDLIVRQIVFIGDSKNITYKIIDFIKIISIMYGEKVRIENSKKLRGVGYYSFGIIDGVYMFFSDLFMTIKFSYNKLNKLKNNMVVNKGEVNSLKYKYLLNKWKKTDTILLIINFLMIFIILIY
ncbi:MAG: hypothetical protein VZS44_08390 [Bacilli bacterium]|nr:hypothetical protein [Bacilli bacterium]